MTETADPGRPDLFRKPLHTLLLLVAIGLPAFFAARNMATWPNRIRYPGELDTVEGRVLAEMVMLRKGTPIYSAASEREFHAANYGPLFYLAGAALIDPAHPAYQSMRILSMFAELGLAAGCGLLAWWTTGRPVAAALAALMLLAFRFVSLYGVCLRSDTLALLLSFSGFLAAYRWQGSSKILWSIPPLVLGAFYKQQFIAGPLAIFLFLILEKRGSLAVRFAGIMAAAGAGMLLVFQFVIFRGQAFVQHFLFYNLIPFRPSQEGLPWLPLISIVLLIPVAMAVRALQVRHDKLLACYLGCSIILLPIMLSKVGTEMNYCLELLLVVCPLAAGLVTASVSSPGRAVVMIYFLGVGLALGQITRRGSGEPTRQDVAADRAVHEYLQANFSPGTPALGDFSGDLVRAGLATPFTDPFQYTWLVCAGRISGNGLLQQVRNREFSVILMTRDLSDSQVLRDPGMLPCMIPVPEAILQNYRLARSFEFQLAARRHYYAWVPRN